MSDERKPAADEDRGKTPAAALLALGLGRTDAAHGEDQEDDDAELEQFLCALPDLELYGCLGRGGMGRVYRARQFRLDRFVAVKLMNAELGSDPEFRDRFEREARALARLDHPGVVRVHDFGEAGGVFYLIMELVEGPSLRDLMVDRLSPEHATQVIGQLCDALAYAHARGVVHRDIKPENVLIDREGRIKVADFGLAKLQQVDHRATTRRVVGTPQYMAPEQLSDPGSVDHRADVFAIGVVFYEMLTGQLPVGRFPSPSELGRGDALIDRVVLRALESSREKRFQAASEIREALQSRPIDDPETVTRPGIEPAGARQRTRMRAPQMIAAGAIAAGTLGFGVYWLVTPEPTVDVPAVVVAEVDGPTAPSDPPPEPAVAMNRWPATDLAKLSPDTAMVIGVDWADLRQAPALDSLQAGLDDEPAWKKCYADVVMRTHKLVLAIDADANPTEVIAHADWEPDDLETCLRATASADGATKVSVKREPYGGFVRFTSTREGRELVSVVVAEVDSRLWMSFRSDLTEARVHELFGNLEQGSDIAERMGARVDLGAPIWVLASQVPGDWDGKPTAAWGHLSLWEVLQVNATLAFDDEATAEKMANMLRGYGTVITNIEDAPKLDLEVKHEAKNVVVAGSVEVPKDVGGHFKLTPQKSDDGLSFSLKYSD